MKLTKTDFIQYLNCRESLWLTKNKPDKAMQGEQSLFLKKLLEEGQEVEAFAEKLFPDAMSLPVNGTPADTSLALESEASSFFQAAFQTDNGVYGRVDVLERLPQGTWHLYEVKSSSGVSTKKSHNHIYDACFQKYLLEMNGLNIEKVTIIHLNKEYVKDGEIVPEHLLTFSDISAQVDNVFDFITIQVHKALSFIRQSEIDESQCSCLRKTRSNHCDNFFYFNKGLPEHPIHELKRITENKLNSLLDMGCKGLGDVPESFGLNIAQKRQVDSFKEGRPQIDMEAIYGKLGHAAFPLHFYDYETYASAVPKLDGAGPHQHIPFQVSIHTVLENGNVRHFEYLSAELEMPRQMLEEMAAFTGFEGTFVSWHASFENSRNTDMKSWMPQYGTYLDYINVHTFDLEDFFKDDYIDYRFGGSSSIKKVLPVLLDSPNLKYDTLSVQDGTMAMDVWGRMVFGNPTQEQINRTRKELLAYCKLDTLAMVEIYQYLKAL
nr:DUF2779 domain-containing protein [Allomuricauda sp.]